MPTYLTHLIKTEFAMLIKDIMNFLLPPLCVICGNRLQSSEKSVCADCMAGVVPTNYHLSSPNPLERLFWGKIPIDRAVAFMLYHNKDARRIVMSNKYLSHSEVGYNIGYAYAKDIASSGFFEGVDVIVPVPISWQRMWKRRYNQSEYIARGVSDATGIPLCTNAVKKIKHTASQTRVTRDERFDNVNGVYQLVRPKALHGKQVLLVDDVVTTGSTLLSCAKELMKAGDVTFSILALAHAYNHIDVAFTEDGGDSSLYKLPFPFDF